MSECAPENRLLSITDHFNPAQNVTYTYDANGNQTSQSTNGQSTQFVYDARDKLASLALNANGQTRELGQYRYDYQGLRVEKITGNGAERQRIGYVYDGQSVLSQFDESGDTIAKYDYGPDQLLSLAHRDQGRQFYLFDALGSIANLTRSDGSVQARYWYDAWGAPRKQSGDSWNSFGFTGHERDKESGLYYFKARFYDPQTARFLTQDSYLGEAGTPPSLHRYLYAYANPTVYVDPDGHQSKVYRWTDENGQVHFGDRPPAVERPAPQERALSKTERLIQACQARGERGCVFSVDRQLQEENRALPVREPVQVAENQAGPGTELDDVAEITAHRKMWVSISQWAGPGLEVLAVALPSRNAGGVSKLGRQTGEAVADTATHARPSVGQRVPGSVEELAGGQPQSLTYNHQLKADKVTDIPELQRQVKRQEAAFNKILQNEGIEGLKQRVRQFRQDPRIAVEGRRRVKELEPAGPGKAHLHEPDMAAGGKPADITGVGALRENSILGGQANRIGDEILEMPADTTCIQCFLNLIPPKGK